MKAKPKNQGSRKGRTRKRLPLWEIPDHALGRTMSIRFRRNNWFIGTPDTIHNLMSIVREGKRKHGRSKAKA